MAERLHAPVLGDRVGFGVLLRALRERALVSQEQLAERSGLSIRAIGNLEQGRVANPRGESVRLLADALRLTGQDRQRFEDAARQLAVPAPSREAGSQSAPSGLVPCLLPPDVADFTGRAAQVGLLRELLTATAVGGSVPAVMVSAVAGKAGVGKTALAVHVAHQLRGEFPDGQLYVNLRGTDRQPLDPGVVLARFLRVLGVDGAAISDGLDERAELYRARTAGRRVLVVLDNAATEAQVRPLLPGTPGCGVLVTSRGRLAGLEGARLVDLEVLEERPAVELLARIVGITRVAGEQTAATDIVGYCGYLPLAVRVVGARLAARPHWPLGKLAGLLADEHRRLDQLAAGDLEVRASLALSYQALGSEQQRAFRLLGALEVGDFSAWVAGPLLGIAHFQAEGLVEQLADAQLLDLAGMDGTGACRYRLHDLVRLYAREQLAAEEPMADRRMALARVTAGWLALAEQADRRLPITSDVVAFGGAARWLFPPGLVDRWLTDPLGWLELERPNLVAAVEAAAAAGLEEVAWELAGCLTSFFLLRSYWASWAWVQEAALRACRLAGNRRGEAAALTALGRMSSSGGQTCSDDGQDLLRRALAIFRDLGDQRGEAKTLHDLADVMRLRRHQASSAPLLQAISYARQAHQLACAIGDNGLQADALLAVGGAYRYLGRWADASEALEQAQRLTVLAGDRHGQAVAMWHLAMVARATGRPDDAVALLAQSLEIVRSQQDRSGQAQLLLSLGQVRVGEGRLEEAEVLMEAAIAAGPSQVTTPTLRAQIIDGLGQLRCRQRRYDQAAGLFTEAATIWQEMSAHAAQAQSLTALAAALTAAGRPQQARTARQQARTITPQSWQ